MQKSLLSNLKKLLLIVFSVVLGIFLSERIEESKNKKEAELLLSKIKSEINDNKNLLEKWVPYHRVIVNRLDSLNKNEQFINSFIDDQSVLFTKVFTNGNLMGRAPSNDAWDIAKSHPLIVHFDYEELLIMSKVYNQQLSAFESMPELIQIFLSPDFNSQKKAKLNLQEFTNKFAEVVSREIQLMDYFKEADRILKIQSN